MRCEVTPGIACLEPRMNIPLRLESPCWPPLASAQIDYVLLFGMPVEIYIIRLGLYI